MMKLTFSMPLAVAATMLAPKTEDVPLIDESVEKMRQNLVDKEIQILRLRNIAEKFKAGKPVDWSELGLPEIPIPDAENLQEARQKVTDLQQQYEELRIAAGIEEEQVEEEAPKEELNTGKPHPKLQLDEYRMAKLLYQSKDPEKHRQALIMFQKESTPWADFWASKTLEKMGRDQDAVKSYRTLIHNHPESEAAQLAKTVADYLERRISLDQVFKIDRILEAAAEISKQAKSKEEDENKADSGQ